jgi:N-acetylglucosamine kinase-like BadF-type ATPase
VEPLDENAFAVNTRPSERETIWLVTQVVLGIDAGGTSTVVQAAIAGRGVFEGRGGPGNAATTPVAELERHIEDATRSSPSPEVVSGCFAGMSTDASHAVVTSILRRRFPQAELRLTTDCAAAVAASDNADVVVIAGTGSVVASLSSAGIETTGGHGFLIGDRGSGFRYGQAVLEHALREGPSQLGADVAETLLVEFGTLDVSDIVRTVHETPLPAIRVARLCGLLARRAEAGERWALELVDAESELLAADAARHIELHIDEHRVRVDLAGGVWASASIRDHFVKHLDQLTGPRPLQVQRAQRRPVEGAVALCQLTAKDFRRFTQWPTSRGAQ